MNHREDNDIENEMTEERREREEIRRRRLRKYQKQRNFMRGTIVVFFIALVFSIFGLSKAVSQHVENIHFSPTVRPKATLPPSNTPTPTPTSTPTPTMGPTVIIDAGHGGEDPGTLGYMMDEEGIITATIYEKDINLNIALKTREVLESLGFTVIMTREDDTYLSPKERARLSKDRTDVQAFVSIHLNAGPAGDTESHGIETLYHDHSYFDGIYVESHVLAETLQSAVVSATGERDRSAKDNGSFEVLYNTHPACIIECGFISSTKEQVLLISSDYQQKLAEGIADGLVKFFK